MAKKIIKKLIKGAGSLRPTINKVGNNIDFDSIYNHSVPKKLKKQYADWFEENILDAPEHIPGEGSSRGFLNKWANATDEGIETYLNDIRTNYSPASAKAIEDEIYTNRQKAIDILNESRKKFNDATQSSINSHIYNTTTTLENARINELPISRERASEIIQNTVNKAHTELGLTDDLLVNIISGTEKNGNRIHRGVHSTDEIGIYLDGIYESASQKNREKQIIALREQYKDMGEDEFFEMLHNKPELINPLTAEEYERELIEVTSHETRHHWQQEQNQEQFYDGNRKLDRSQETYSEYYDQDIEVDARKYADDFVNKHADEIRNPNYKSVVEPNNTINANIVENNIDNATKSTGHTNRSRRDGKNVRQQYEQRKKTKNKGRSGNKPGKQKPSKSIEQLKKEAQQRKWSTETYKKWQEEETINKINSTRQMYEDVLADWQSSSGNFSESVDNYKLTNTHKMYSEVGEYLDYVEDLKVNYNLDDYFDGSYTMEQEVFKYSEGKGINGEDVLKVEGDLVDAPNAYASDLNKTLEEAKKTMSPEEYQKYKNNFDVEGALVKTETGRTKLNRKKVVRNKAGLLDDIGKPGAIMTGLNILGAVGDYKDARRKGHGVISSAARAGVQFAVGEALGLWAIPVMAAKEVPGLVMKGAETLYKENRRMNSAANFQTFGDVQFQDTQQLATMRQSGMEMAKMSQYNLQQTLMGNEATYLHR